MAKKFTVITVLFLLGLFLVGCESSTDPSSSDARREENICINSMSVSPQTVHVNDVVWIDVDYTYVGEENVDFIWSCTSGQFIETKGSSGIAWQAPHFPGTFSVYVTVNDRCSNAHEGILITVLPGNEIEPEMA